MMQDLHLFHKWLDIFLSYGKDAKAQIISSVELRATSVVLCVIKIILLPDLELRRNAQRIHRVSQRGTPFFTLHPSPLLTDKIVFLQEYHEPWFETQTRHILSLRP